MQYIILLSNSDRRVQAFGTNTGRTFGSESAAERAAARIRKKRPTIDALVLPVNDYPQVIL